jgi:hypothetical protein
VTNLVFPELISFLGRNRRSSKTSHTNLSDTKNNIVDLVEGDEKNDFYIFWDDPENKI